MKAHLFPLFCARLAALLLLWAGVAPAQDTFGIGWSTVTGGGALRSGAGEFTMSGAIGQFSAGTNPVGPPTEFSMTGGFWTLPPGFGASADLAGLIISSGALSPSFESALTSYTTTVSTDTTSFMVSPFASEAGATLQVRINGGSYFSVASGGTTAPMALNPGANPIEVLVTSANTTSTKLYTLTVTRTPPGTPGEVEALNAELAGFVVNAMVVDPLDRILLAGSISSVQGTPRSHLARLLADGTLDAGFNPQLNADVVSVAVQPDGKILIGGNFTSVNGQPRSRLARLNSDGTLDSTFNPAPDNYVLTVVPDGSGKILIGGGFATVQGQPRAHLARLNEDGTLDTAFAPGIGGVVYCAAVQPDGKILTGGAFATAGGQTRNGIARLHASGALDTGFDANANAFVATINVLGDGKILLGGGFTAVGAQSRPYLARVLAGGALDPAFQPSPNNNVFGAAVQADGKVLLAGHFTTVGGQNRGHVARVHADGTLDSSFAPDANGNVFSVALQADGKVLLGGEFFTVNGTIRNRFARINNDLPIRQLTLPNGTTVLWTRGGSAPDLTQVTFERDSGSAWALIGPGVRVGASSWQITVLNLAGGGIIRARGRTSSGYLSGGAGLIEQQQAYSVVNPNAIDTDGDGFNDPTEAMAGSNPLAASSVPPPTHIARVFGYGPGRGLDLTGNFLYAFNVGTTGARGLAGDAFFTADSAPGITVAAPHEFSVWGNPTLGTSAQDNVLEDVFRSMRHASAGNPDPALRKVSVNLTGLTPGRRYKLQLLFGEACCETRVFDVRVAGIVIARDFKTAAAQGTAVIADAGSAIVHEFIAGRSSLDIELDGSNATPFAGYDPTAILNGATLELLPDALTDWYALHNVPANGRQDTGNPSGDGISNLLKYAFNMTPSAGGLNQPDLSVLTPGGTAGLPDIFKDPNNGLVFHFIRRKAPGELDYIPEISSDLQTWTPVSLTNAGVSGINSTWERVVAISPDSVRQIGRVTVVSRAASRNEFATGPAGAILSGSAAWTTAGIRLTDNTMGHLGGMVMESPLVVPAQTGFTASFNVTLGPSTTVVPADGMSFVVGDPGSSPWGESGPHTAHSLALGFDTYDNGPANDNIGIHLWINGTHAAVSPANPYTNGFPTLVQVRYTATGKLSLTYGGKLIFSEIATPGFTLQPGDRYGFGARTGGATQVCTVDDVMISPQ